MWQAQLCHYSCSPYTSTFVKKPTWTPEKHLHQIASLGVLRRYIIRSPCGPLRDYVVVNRCKVVPFIPPSYLNATRVGKLLSWELSRCYSVLVLGIRLLLYIHAANAMHVGVILGCVSIFCKLLEDSGAIKILCWVHSKTRYAMSSWIVETLDRGRTSWWPPCEVCEFMTCRSSHSTAQFLDGHSAGDDVVKSGIYDPNVHVQQLITFGCLCNEDHMFHLHRKDAIPIPHLTFFFPFLYLVVNRQQLTCETCLTSALSRKGHTWSSSSVELNGSPPWLCYWVRCDWEVESLAGNDDRERNLTFEISLNLSSKRWGNDRKVMVVSSQCLPTVVKYELWLVTLRHPTGDHVVVGSYDRRVVRCW